jgi:hypothetical protein
MGYNNLCVISNSKVMQAIKKDSGLLSYERRKVNICDIIEERR